MKSVRIWSYSGPYSVRLWENTVQNNFEYGYFLRSVVNMIIHETKYSRMGKVTFVEISLLITPYRFKFFKDCLPQILLGPFLNTLPHMFFEVSISQCLLNRLLLNINVFL